MPDANLYSLFRQRFPDDPAALFLDDPSGRQLRYAEVDVASGRIQAFSP